MSKITVFYIPALPLFIQVMKKFGLWELNMHHRCYKVM